jgi:SPP1 gp7 family putative phage head morphogenesis protein
MPKRIRLTTAERIEIFRPHVTLQRLDAQESAFVLDAMFWVRQQTENLAIQLTFGKSPKLLTLEPNAVRGIADALAKSMIDTYAMGEVSIQNELIHAENIRQTKLTGAYKPNVVPFAATSPFTPSVGLDWYQSYTLRLAGVHSVDALENTKAAIIQGVESGLNQEQTIALLRKQFPDFSEHRLENIARTETAKIYEQSRYQQMASNDEVVGYEYLAIMDSRTCPICAPHDGMKLSKDKIEGWLPPLHFMCRCTIVPIFAWEQGIQYNTLDIAPPPLPGFGLTDMVIPETARNAIHIGGIPELRQVVKVAEMPKVDIISGMEYITDNWGKRVTTEQMASFEQASRNAGMTIDEYKKSVDDHVKQLIAEGSPQLQIQRKDLLAVLKDGEFKTQHSTGTSGGAVGKHTLELRSPFENEVYGAHPVYGFWGPKKGDVFNRPDTPRDKQSGLAQYGDVTVKFKEEVSKKTTLIFGDSGDVTGWGKEANVLPMTPKTADYRSVGYHKPVEGFLGGQKKDILSYDSIQSMARDNTGSSAINYIETQYHGKLKADDIKSVTIGYEERWLKRPDTMIGERLIELVDALKKHNITYEFITL